MSSPFLLTHCNRFFRMLLDKMCTYSQSRYCSVLSLHFRYVARVDDDDDDDVSPAEFFAMELLTTPFPTNQMVLAGTALTALIAYYIFPYGWSFNLAMTFGAILSATDPVAVAALLEQVGAPPRLKVHIAGEALLNDGAAVSVFTWSKEKKSPSGLANSFSLADCFL